MSEQTSSGAKKFGLAGIGALVAGALYVILHGNGSEPPRPTPGTPPVSGTIATETVPATGTSSTTDTVQPEPAVPPLVPAPSTTDIGWTERQCDADDIARAERYSKNSGYEYLSGRCDLIRRWKDEGGNVVDRLCDWGYDSPAATTEYEETWTLTQDETDSIFKEHYDTFLVHEKNRGWDATVKWKGPVAFLDVDKNTLKIKFSGPCWWKNDFQVTPALEVGKKVMCRHGDTNQITDGPCQ